MFWNGIPFLIEIWWLLLTVPGACKSCGRPLFFPFRQHCQFSWILTETKVNPSYWGRIPFWSHQPDQSTHDFCGIHQWTSSEIPSTRHTKPKHGQKGPRNATRSREAEKPRSREARHKPRSREAEKPRSTTQAEKPRSREATEIGRASCRERV